MWRCRMQINPAALEHAGRAPEIKIEIRRESGRSLHERKDDLERETTKSTARFERFRRCLPIPKTGARFFRRDPYVGGQRPRSIDQSDGQSGGRSNAPFEERAHRGRTGMPCRIHSEEGDGFNRRGNRVPGTGAWLLAHRVSACRLGVGRAGRIGTERGPIKGASSQGT